MKKNITINLCGRLFQIDEDAYELLQQYIDSLRSSFGKQEGGEEIVDDIEARIAELFDELRQQGIEAINIDHVKDIISRIGKPEELTDNDGSGNENGNNENGNKGHRFDSFRSAAQSIEDNVRARTAGKKLYRNPKDKMLTGLCSGFAAYTNSDPVVWRLLFVLLVLIYGVGIISYIVLAIAVPEARTPEQLLQMEGKDVTPQNLADVVVDKEGQTEKRPSLLHSFFSVMLKLLAGLLIVLLAIAGLVLLVCFLLIAGTLIVVFTVPGASHRSLPFDLGYMSLPEVYATHPWVVVIFVVSLLLVFITPIYAIGHGLLAKAGKLKPMSTWQNVAWIIVWLLAMAANFPSLLTIQDLRQAERKTDVAESRPWSYYINDVSMTEPDYNFFSANNWVMVKHNNTDEYYSSLTAGGEYLTGDESIRYLEGHAREKSQLVYQAEHTECVEPGIYSLNCIVRADGRGTFVYTQVDGKKRLKEIPPYGRKGGELWMGITKAMKENGKDMRELRAEPQWKQDAWRNIAKANHSQGFGWSEVQIDDIVVVADSIPVVYGVSTVPAFTGQSCHAHEFSATDFVLTRTGDLPK